MMYSGNWTTRSFIIISVLMMVVSLLIGLHILFRSQVFIALASQGQSPDRVERAIITSKSVDVPSTAAIPPAMQPITGVVLAPTDAWTYSYIIYTAPEGDDYFYIRAEATWSNDWHTPSPTETTQSYPNLVTIPYQGGTGCDYIYDYPENNFAKLSLDAQDQFDQVFRRILIGPGMSVAIAGSDCGFDDNFHAHYRIEWTAFESERVFLPLVNRRE